MGCCGSGANQNPTVEAARRRLSVGAVEKKDGDEVTGGAGDAEANRGLMVALDDKSLTELIEEGAPGGRKFSIGSATDKGLTSFANKQTASEGDKGALQSNIGYTCRKGLKPESPNQDSWTVLEVPDNFSIYGVFDGHGQKGHDISNYVKQNLPKLLLTDKRFQAWMKAEPGTDERDLVPIQELAKEGFKKMQSLIATAQLMKKLDAQLAGTTATMCIHDHKASKYLLAHVADSTCVLGKQGNRGDALTRDHKPDLKDERARIEKAGGRVVFDGYANHRIYAKNGRYPGLNMSRCLGDLLGHQDCGITAEPETKVLDVKPEDSVLLLCSDGVWEFIDPVRAVSIVMEFYNRGRASEAAEKLAKEAWDRWIQEEGGAVVDDITVVCVFLNAPARN